MPLNTETAMNVIAAKLQTKPFTSAFIRSLPLAPGKVSKRTFFYREFLTFYEQQMLSRLAMARALTGSIQPNSPAVKVPLAFSAKLIGHDVGDQRGNKTYQGYKSTRQMIIEGARGKHRQNAAAGVRGI